MAGRPVKTYDRAPTTLPLTATQRQYLDGWIQMLDVNLELAQATLRLGDRQLPCPPPAPEAPAELEPPPIVTNLRGAYARRAAR